MKMYEFSVIASGLDPQADDFEARFYDNGCDDALVSFQNGHVIIDFTRAAETFDCAIASAVEAVAATGARIVRIEPDPLVSLSDIAKRANMTRAAISNYHRGQRGAAFPSPAARITSDSPLWEWADVARWLASGGKLSRATAVEAELVRQANLAVQRGEVHIGPMLKARSEQFERDLAT
ncbi:helix-turn-helix transcriptional regulator [Thalassobaculum litoreum]|uniref:DNA-binding protein n=1 Tax=Thalassobaculum litoreum DSM 18839 TaxID=1123362 RepID=A0A8G2EZA6_9PROT|nr:hypothetical protein [Thalassobaculum litoreum]SDF97191.1 hypothetical protein SAMN05660686_02948 [Thalassobaculum litoreum DSM 18839]